MLAERDGFEAGIFDNNNEAKKWLEHNPLHPLAT
jgi:hypothetical protein